MEAADAGITLIVAITEGIPVLDMARAKRFLLTKPGARLIGPNCPGVITPASARSASCRGTFTSRARPAKRESASSAVPARLPTRRCSSSPALGLPQSTCVGIGGDPVIGTSQIDLLEMFENDEQTSAILMIGEIGGTAEEDAAAFVAKKVTKPVAAFIAGQTAPPAGGWATRGRSSAAAAAARLTRSRRWRRPAAVAPTPADLGTAVQKAIAKKK